MARPLRFEYAGALYHITSRGNRREDIYEDDEDRELFLSVLGEVCCRFNWLCHAYCLMSNHYHLLIETPDGNLSKGMRQLNGVYAQRFNRRHKRIGYVFQGRFKGVLVDKNDYLLEVARYIVLNPVRAEMVRSVVHWPWSSYRATIGQAKAPEWLVTGWVLAAFSKRKATAIEKYKVFVSAGKGLPSLWKQLRNQVFLGSKEFVEKQLKLFDSEKNLNEVPSGQRRCAPKSLAEYAQAYLTRDAAINAAYASGGYS